MEAETETEQSEEVFESQHKEGGEEKERQKCLPHFVSLFCMSAYLQVTVDHAHLVAVEHGLKDLLNAMTACKHQGVCVSDKLPLTWVCGSKLALVLGEPAAVLANTKTLSLLPRSPADFKMLCPSIKTDALLAPGQPEARRWMRGGRCLRLRDGGGQEGIGKLYDELT